MARKQDGEVSERIQYSLTTLSEYCKRTKMYPEFMKIDTEGFDLKILKGSIESNRPLSGSILEKVLAISCEVYFEEVFQNAPSFGEINSFLLGHGFKLANLAYNGQGIPTSYFCPNPNYFGFISGGEATYVKSFKNLDTLNKLKLALFSFSNRLEDYAHLILNSLTQSEINPHLGTDNWHELKREFALCTKKLMYLPGDQFQRAKIDYEKIFQSKFPEMHHFYEDDELNPI